MIGAKSINEYKENGFILLKGIFRETEIIDLHNEAKSVFKKQLIHLGIIEKFSIEEKEFENGMFQLFELHFDTFVNTGKQVQHLLSLHRIALSNKIDNILRSLGLKSPNISTRPVLYFNHEKLAKDKVYHTVFPHQDWRSMQGSLDSVVVWIPLINIDKQLGALEVLPGSHFAGLRTEKVEFGFGKVSLTKEELAQMQSIEVEAGDALFFSSLLIHQSGTNTSGRIRWSAHFRFNNLDDPTFISRKYAHPYLYRPQEDLITQDFPLGKDVKKIFGNGK